MTYVIVYLYKNAYFSMSYSLHTIQIDGTYITIAYQSSNLTAFNTNCQ